MAFENDTNLGRVQKMIETLTLIEKSAMSNRAGKDQVAALLRPLSDAVAALTGHPAEAASPGRTDTETPSAERPGSWTGKAPQWASVHDMAEQADLKDLTYAMAVYLNRIDEALK